MSVIGRGRRHDVAVNACGNADPSRRPLLRALYTAWPPPTATAHGYAAHLSGHYHVFWCRLVSKDVVPAASRGRNYGHHPWPARPRRRGQTVSGSGPAGQNDSTASVIRPRVWPVERHQHDIQRARKTRPSTWRATVARTTVPERQGKAAARSVWWDQGRPASVTGQGAQQMGKDQRKTVSVTGQEAQPAGRDNGTANKAGTTD